MAPKPPVRRSTQTKPTEAGAAGSVKMSKSQIVLLVLSIEKFVQHMFVTYAFAVDMGGIRDWLTAFLDDFPTTRLEVTP